MNSIKRDISNIGNQSTVRPSTLSQPFIDNIIDRYIFCQFTVTLFYSIMLFYHSILYHHWGDYSSTQKLNNFDLNAQNLTYFDLLYQNYAKYWPFKLKFWHILNFRLKCWPQNPKCWPNSQISTHFDFDWIKHNCPNQYTICNIILYYHIIIFYTIIIIIMYDYSIHQLIEGQLMDIITALAAVLSVSRRY